MIDNKALDKLIPRKIGNRYIVVNIFTNSVFELDIGASSIFWLHKGLYLDDNQKETLYMMDKDTKKSINDELSIIEEQ